MIIKVVAIAFLVIIFGRALIDPFIKEKKRSSEEYSLGFDPDKKASVQEIQKSLKDHAGTKALLVDPAIYLDPEIVWDMDSWEGIMNVQRALKQGGYYEGKIDGKSGPMTKKAIKAFQRSRKLTADGVVGRKTLDRLRALLPEEGDHRDR